jgi:hypothetical protein
MEIELNFVSPHTLSPIPFCKDNDLIFNDCFFRMELNFNRPYLIKAQHKLVRNKAPIFRLEASDLTS